MKIVNGISNKAQFIDCRRASSQHGRGFQKKIKNIYIPYNRPHLAGHPARVKVFFFLIELRGVGRFVAQGSPPTLPLSFTLEFGLQQEGCSAWTPRVRLPRLLFTGFGPRAILQQRRLPMPPPWCGWCEGENNSFLLITYSWTSSSSMSSSSSMARHFTNCHW